MFETRIREEDGRVLVAGFSVNQATGVPSKDACFSISLCPRSRGHWEGMTLDRPVIEIEWFQIYPELSSYAVAKAAVCAALSEALRMIGETPSLVGLEAIETRMMARLDRRPEFSRKPFDQYPFPFFAQSEDIDDLVQQLCASR